MQESRKNSPCPPQGKTPRKTGREQFPPRALWGLRISSVRKTCGGLPVGTLPVVHGQVPLLNPVDGGIQEEDEDSRSGRHHRSGLGHGHSRSTCETNSWGRAGGSSLRLPKGRETLGLCTAALTPPSSALHRPDPPPPRQSLLRTEPRKPRTPTPALTWRAGPGRPTPDSRSSHRAPGGPGDERRRALPANQAQRPRFPAPPAARPRAAEARRRAAPSDDVTRPPRPAPQQGSRSLRTAFINDKICLKYTRTPVDTLQTLRWAPRLPAPASPRSLLRGPRPLLNCRPSPGQGCCLEGGCFLRAMQGVPRPCRTERSLCWRHKEATVCKN